MDGFWKWLSTVMVLISNDFWANSNVQWGFKDETYSDIHNLFIVAWKELFSDKISPVMKCQSENKILDWVKMQLNLPHWGLSSV
jgi:hypothetical protein